jgi:dipeptidyl aminopeptidase/acylaminoacyl peptidase
VPGVDPDRIYTAGHSSAATLSLLVAEHEPGIKGCVAFAPASDVEKRLGAQGVAALDGAVPGFADFVRRTSPLTNAARLRCPLFLFHADDDTNVKVEESARFADLVRRTNSRVTFVRVPTGGHYEPMIREGIPRAIAWFQSLPAPPTARPSQKG